MSNSEDLVDEEKGFYAGRWVANLRGRIVAQGGTPQQAHRAAQTRFKETPEIVFMPTNHPLTFSPLLDSVREVLPEDLIIYLVGGAVRDALLDYPTHDLDFALSGDAIKTARRVANALKADFYPLDLERDTGRVLVTSNEGIRTVMDFATFRGFDLESDLEGRDFTVNAIAMDLHSEALYDPLGGAMDLKEKRLRACSPSAFEDDPVRILRGVRMAAAFGFHILPETRKAMKGAVSLLGKTSPERLRDELFRILEGPQSAVCIHALDVLEALKVILPELSSLKGVEQPVPHIHDVWMHTLATMQHLESTLAVLTPDYKPDKASNLLDGLLVLSLGRYRQRISEYFAGSLTVNRSLRGLLFFAAMYHDIAKPSCKKADENGQMRFWNHDRQGEELAANRARFLVLSNDEIEHLGVVIRNHMRVLFHTNRLIAEQKQPTRRAIYRFFHDSGSAGVDIILLALADMRATYEQTLTQESWIACLDVCRQLLENWWEKPEESVAPPPLVNGGDLIMRFDLQPGPKIGELLEAIREAQATGKVQTREDAVIFARDYLAKKME